MSAKVRDRKILRVVAAVAASFFIIRFYVNFKEYRRLKESSSGAASVDRGQTGISANTPATSSEEGLTWDTPSKLSLSWEEIIQKPAKTEQDRKERAGYLGYLPFHKQSVNRQEFMKIFAQAGTIGNKARIIKRIMIADLMNPNLPLEKKNEIFKLAFYVATNDTNKELYKETMCQMGNVVSYQVGSIDLRRYLDYGKKAEEIYPGGFRDILKSKRSYFKAHLEVMSPENRQIAVSKVESIFGQSFLKELKLDL